MISFSKYIYLFRYIHIWRIHEQKVPKIIWFKWFSAWIVIVFLDGRHASSEIWWILLRLIPSLWFSKDRSKSSRGDEARRGKAVHKSKRFMRKVFTSDPELKKPKRRTQRELPRGSIMNLYWSKSIKGKQSKLFIVR